MAAIIMLTLMSPPVGFTQKTIFHSTKHSVRKLQWNVKTHGRSAVLCHLQPAIMQDPVVMPICQRNAFAKKTEDVVWLKEMGTNTKHKHYIPPKNVLVISNINIHIFVYYHLCDLNILFTPLVLRIKNGVPKIKQLRQILVP